MFKKLLILALAVMFIGWFSAYAVAGCDSNCGNGYGNTGTGNQGNDKNVGNTGGDRNEGGDDNGGTNPGDNGGGNNGGGTDNNGTTPGDGPGQTGKSSGVDNDDRGHGPYRGDVNDFCYDATGIMKRWCEDYR